MRRRQVMRPHEHAVGSFWACGVFIHIRSPTRCPVAVGRSTALLVLDAQLRILAWTWYLACPEVQVAAEGSQWVSGGWACPLGAGGSFQPPWAKGVFDARLLRVAGRLLISSSCRGCTGGIKWSLLQFTADATSDGGLRGLRVGFFLHVPFPSHEVIGCLPQCREVMLGVLGADLVAFHTFARLRCRVTLSSSYRQHPELPRRSYLEYAPLPG